MYESRRFEIVVGCVSEKWKSSSFGPSAFWGWDWMEESSSGLKLVLHAEAGTFDDDRFGVVEEPVQNG
jgi:hypothetical protein